MKFGSWKEFQQFGIAPKCEKPHVEFARRQKKCDRRGKWWSAISQERKEEIIKKRKQTIANKVV